MNQLFKLSDNSKQRIYSGKLWMANSHSESNQFVSKFIKPPRLDAHEKLLAESVLVPPRRYNLEGEIPICISDRGELICIQKEKDPNTIGMIGTKRTGKTLILRGLRDRTHKYMNDYVCELNDYQGESTYACQPQMNQEFINKLWLIGEKPTPIPAIHLYPMNSRKIIKTHDYVHKELSLPFNEVINNIKDFVGESKGSFKYMRKIQEELIKVKSTEEMRELIKNLKPDESREFIDALISDLIKSGVIDLNKKKESTLQVKGLGVEEEYSPLISYLRCNLVPILMTSGIVKKEYYPAYLNYYLKEIFDIQTRDGTFFKRNNKMIHLYLDELPMIGKAGGAKNNIAIDMVEEIVLAGGPGRISFNYCSQTTNPREVPKSILTNTKHFICTQMSSDEAKRITNVIGKQRGLCNRIAGLKKFNFECMLLTTERWVCYDLITNKRYTTDEPIKGTFLPPLSHSLPPSQ